MQLNDIHYIHFISWLVSMSFVSHLTILPAWVYWVILLPFLR